MTKPQDSSEKNNKPVPPPLHPNRIIKTSSCQALSGNGEIGYEFSLDNKKTLHIRITSNSGGGFFSNVN